MDEVVPECGDTHYRLHHDPECKQIEPSECVVAQATVAEVAVMVHEEDTFATLTAVVDMVCLEDLAFMTSTEDQFVCLLPHLFILD